jgi:hypothetical protein
MARSIEETRRINRDKMREQYHSDPEIRARRLASSRKWHRAYYARTIDYQRECRYQKKYGISRAQYDTLLAKQDGKCALCRCPPKLGKKLVVDHNHKTGMVRGLLCDGCNRALGLVEARSLVMIAFYLDQRTSPIEDLERAA